MYIAIIGCGFVADYYMQTLRFHPELVIAGVTDRDPERCRVFAEYYGVHAYESVQELLEDDRVEIVLNLTNPRSHYEVSRACIDADKHVYTEKPIAMSIAQAAELVDDAEQRGLMIVSAPCSLLGEAAQTFWKALREGFIGRPRLVYANMDEGMVFKLPYQSWKSDSGAPWPFRDEFEVGTTIEHAGYVLTWLAAFFGPAVTVTGFAANLFPDKVPGERLNRLAPDFAVAVIKFTSGVVARLGCSLIATHDHAVTVFGDDGMLTCDDTWFYGAPVYTRKSIRIRRRVVPLPWKSAFPPVRKIKRYNKRGVQQMDFARGPAELAAAVRESRNCRLSPRFCLHVNELALAVDGGGQCGGVYHMTTTFDDVEPMPWGK